VHFKASKLGKVRRKAAIFLHSQAGLNLDGWRNLSIALIGTKKAKKKRKLAQAPDY